MIVRFNAPTCSSLEYIDESSGSSHEEPTSS
jgi:hypothetical protein